MIDLQYVIPQLLNALRQYNHLPSMYMIISPNMLILPITYANVFVFLWYWLHFCSFNAVYDTENRARPILATIINI